MCKAYAVLNSSYLVDLLDLGHLGRKKSERMRMFELSVAKEYCCLEQLTCLIWLARLPQDVHGKGDIEKICACVCTYVRMYICTQICALDGRMHNLRTWRT